MAEDTAQEKTEQATPKRLQEARERGQVPRSRELTTMAVLLTAAGSLLLIGDDMTDGILAMMRDALRIQRLEAMDARYVPLAFQEAVFDTLLTLLPFLLVVATVAFFAPMALSGWTFSTKALTFQWEKLDPVKGIKRVFSVRGLVELAKALVKFSVVLVIALLLLWNNMDSLMALGTGRVESALAAAGATLMWAFLLLSSSMIVIAAFDIPFQLWDYQRQLRMTRQEVRDEYRETDGSPEMKRRIKEVQQEMARRRMMEEVPKADVVITNPTHYAVAVRYDMERMAAPLVVAKGQNLIAQKIKALAREAGVPVVENKPLAQALFQAVEVGGEIPQDLYRAVAEVLAYVFRLKNRRIGE